LIIFYKNGGAHGTTPPSRKKNYHSACFHEW